MQQWYGEGGANQPLASAEMFQKVYIDLLEHLRYSSATNMTWHCFVLEALSDRARLAATKNHQRWLEFVQLTAFAFCLQSKFAFEVSLLHFVAVDSIIPGCETRDVSAAAICTIVWQHAATSTVLSNISLIYVNPNMALTETPKSGINL